MNYSGLINKFIFPLNIAFVEKVSNTAVVTLSNDTKIIPNKFMIFSHLFINKYFFIYFPPILTHFLNSSASSEKNSSNISFLDISE